VRAIFLIRRTAALLATAAIVGGVWAAVAPPTKADRGDDAAPDWSRVVTDGALTSQPERTHFGYPSPFPRVRVRVVTFTATRDVVLYGYGVQSNDFNVGMRSGPASSCLDAYPQPLHLAMGESCTITVQADCPSPSGKRGSGFLFIRDETAVAGRARLIGHC
jgi:hypothetical protein